jgi:hypothetical protein
MPVPLSVTAGVGFVEELLENVSCPDAVPAAAGANKAFTVIATFGLSVTGNVAPEMLNPPPVNVAALTVTGTFPVELSVIVCKVEAPTATLPKGTLLVLRATVGTAALSCSANT